MKKIKPQYGKVTAPIINAQDSDEPFIIHQTDPEESYRSIEEEPLTNSIEKFDDAEKPEPAPTVEKAVSQITKEPNPFLQTKEIFGKARLTKIGYRMRTDYVEILDIIKKMKKGGYTLEAVLDDAVTFYFENSEDGKEALKKAEIFYS